jgi:hypothetical protein
MRPFISVALFSAHLAALIALLLITGLAFAFVLWGFVFRRRQARVSQLASQIEGLLEHGQWASAHAQLEAALKECPGDPRLVELIRQAAWRGARWAESWKLLLEAAVRLAIRDFEGAERILGAVSTSLRRLPVSGASPGDLRGNGDELLCVLQHDRQQEDFQRIIFGALGRWLDRDLEGAERILRDASKMFPPWPVSRDSPGYLRGVNEELLRVLQYERQQQEFFWVVERAYTLAASGEFQRAQNELKTASAFDQLLIDRLIAAGESGAAQRERQQLATLTQIPSGLSVDNVHFTLTAPGVLVPARASEIRFWIHMEGQRSTVLERAREAEPPGHAGLAVKSEGPFPLQRGARISVRLEVDGLKCAENRKFIVWTGEIGGTTFVVTVPPDAREGPHAGYASIRVGRFEIAKMSFVLNVGREGHETTEVPSSTTCYRSAFASYAKEDRAQVLSEVQGMQKAYEGLEVFIDVKDLRSGEYWENEIVDRIKNRADVFYLFWCRHARASEWVTKEWRLALNWRGLAFIDPVPLEGPEQAPPPPELAAKQFNDPLLPFIAAAGGGHSAT